jgi:oligoendopeptidase F
MLAELPTLTALQGHLGESACVLVQALEAHDGVDRRLGGVYVYALLGYAVDTTDPAAVARFGRAQAAEAQVMAALSFVEPEVLALDGDRLAEWAASDPALAVYAHYLDDLGRRAGHTRSAEVEEVLGLLSDVLSGPFGVYSALVDSDVVFAPALSEDGEPADVTQGSIDALLASADRTPAHAGRAMRTAGGRPSRRTLRHVKQRLTRPPVRSPLVASPGPNVPVEVSNLIMSGRISHLAPLLACSRGSAGRDRRRTLPGAARCRSSDYEQCVEWICASLAPLGATADLRRLHRADQSPTAGKMAGRSSAGSRNAVHRDELGDMA